MKVIIYFIQGGKIKVSCSYRMAEKVKEYFYSSDVVDLGCLQINKVNIAYIEYKEERRKWRKKK